MTTRLRNLKVNEVSIVGRPANKRPFLLMKGCGARMKMTPDEVLALIGTAVEKEDKVIKLMKQENLSDDATEALMSAMRILGAYSDAIPQPVFEVMAETIGYTTPSPSNQVNKGEPNPEGPIKKEDIIGKLPETMRDTVSALFKGYEDLEKQLKEEKDKRATEEAIVKAKAFSHLGVKAEEFGPVLKGLLEKAPEEAKVVEGLLTKADAAIAAGALFKEIGTDAAGITKGSAWAQIEALAGSIVEKDATMTKEQAISRVMDLHPELYQEYLNERKVR